MVLGYDKAIRFYRLLSDLGNFTNDQYGLVPGARDMDFACDPNMSDRAGILKFLWSHTGAIDEYLKERGADLSEEDGATVESWKKVVSGKFVIAAEGRKGGIFLPLVEDIEEGYYVSSIMTGWKDLVFYADAELPVLAYANLLPFDGGIVTDGLCSYLFDVPGEPGWKRVVRDQYRRLKAQGRMRSTL